MNAIKCGIGQEDWVTDFQPVLKRHTQRLETINQTTNSLYQALAHFHNTTEGSTTAIEKLLTSLSPQPYTN